jgi:hypothetical protein
MSLNRFAIHACLAAGIVFSSGLAFAQQTKPVVYGNTRLTLNSTFVTGLSQLKFTVSGAYPTLIQGNLLEFPVTSGAIDLTNGIANIDHSGGMTITQGETTVTLQNFIFDTTGTQAVLTAMASINGTMYGRFPVFDLTLPANFAIPLKPSAGWTLQYYGIVAALSPELAGGLNTAFGTNGFVAGTTAGTIHLLFLVKPD